MDITLRPREELVGNHDTRLLKLLALCLMVVDHLGAKAFPGIPLMRVIGRMALPLYAWSLVVGSCYTRNIGRYLLRLLGLGVISQPLYMLALGHRWNELSILFTLFLGLLAVAGIRAKKWGSHIWMPILCVLVTLFIRVDYGYRGVLFVLVLYLARKTPGGLAAAYIAYALFWGSGTALVDNLAGLPLPFVTAAPFKTLFEPLFRLQAMVWLSLPLILIPMKSGVHYPRWVGYALYPAHLVVIILVRLLMGTSMQALLVGFGA